MKLHNSTDIEDDTIREIIRFVRPPNISNFDVMIKNSKYGGVRGRAYTKGSSYHSTASPFVIVSVQKTEIKKFLTTSGHGGYIAFKIRSRLEMVIFVMAHELRHMWQAKIPKGYRVWGAKGKFSERDADAYAIRKLREWRKHETNSCN